MAPGSPVRAMLQPRQSLDSNNYSSSSDEYCQFNCYSAWDSWGRWAAFVILVAAAVLLGLALSCLNARRRRRRGAAPMYGTGWMAGHDPNPNKPTPPQYYPPQPFYGQPAPPYSPPLPHMQGQTTGNTFNTQDGYYGYHPGAVEMQRPGEAHLPTRAAEPVYDAPEGPPPAKK